MEYIDKALKAFDMTLGYINGLSGSWWYVAAVTLGLAIVISTILEYITKRYHVKYDIKLGKRLMFTIVSFMSFLGSVADIVLTNSPFFATPLLQRFAWIVVIANAYHHFIGNELMTKFMTAADSWTKDKPVKEIVAEATEDTPVVTERTKPDSRLLQL